MTELHGKSVLVTGGARGLGRLLALAAATMGARPVVWDIDDEGLAELATELGERGKTYRCDLSHREEIYEVARRVHSENGQIHVLINNAGIVSGKSLLDIPDEMIEASFAVNIMAHFWTTKAFLPDMLDRDEGHIVTIASAGGLIGVPRLTDYCATKFAAVGFDESLRMELDKRGSRVRTTIVCPFYIDNGLFRGVKTRFPFLLPILDEADVARRILGAITGDRARLYLPPMVHTLAPLRVLPVAWFDAITSFFGINASMDEFVGRASEPADGGNDPARR